MRLALIMAAGFTATYYLGWLPPSFVVPALFVLGFMARAPHSSRARQRGGYVKVSASSTRNQEVIREQWGKVLTDSSSSSWEPGPEWGEPVTPPTRAQLSRLTELGYFGTLLPMTVGPSTGARGAPVTFAASVDGLHTPPAA